MSFVITPILDDTGFISETSYGNIDFGDYIEKLYEDNTKVLLLMIVILKFNY